MALSDVKEGTIVGAGAAVVGPVNQARKLHEKPLSARYAEGRVERIVSSIATNQN